MVYLEAARKTGAYMLLASVMSLGVVTFLSGEATPTGQVVGGNVVADIPGEGWAIFALGVFTGALLLATYVYVAHLERKRQD